MTNCQQCRFWSDRDYHEVTANYIAWRCLSWTSPFAGQFTSPDGGCAVGEDGEAIDLLDEKTEGAA